MNEQDKFEKLVMLLAEKSYHGEEDDAIDAFENKISETGYGDAYFGTAQSDYDRIEVVNPEFMPSWHRAKFYAEYYDGFQAPFTVCEWNDDFDKLELLLKESSTTLFNMYQMRLKELDD